ncbi:MAG: YfbU family protein [Phenylobacterium sp.]|uniref:YfbU family protein n=1 Tax=Phenylobacterium sp. TaxID=1871053 RepID=UPI0025F32E84|nr:YfbU family protein [Phenylobacterium sp.]MCA3723246.1 YfbU family protein [Phenylobacterium sp.]MCA6271635.1 YfbU family protein [Phenylobacterium sp.]MCA6276637.1 YfbU family protein [Phenylobacterium sp.]MCA6294232.1 YfbU family protein [Phenylobacterium sp.]
MMDELKLTKLDRIFLINQLRILEFIRPDEASQLSVQREALERGYELLYDFDFDYIADGDSKMSADECREVWDTMDMFDAIGRSMSEDIDVSNISMTKFLGYDGNNESKFMSFAQFTVERLKRFEYVPMQRQGYWNSHGPVRETYRRMLEKWKEVPNSERFTMSSEQVIRVLTAAIHSENR